MLITGISRTKRGLYALHVDGNFLFSIHEDVYALSGLGTDSLVTQEQLEDLWQRSNQRIARDKALRLTAQRSYTGRQLYQKLLSGTDEQAASQAVGRMEELGLIDDGDYAMRCSRDMYNLKYYAPAGIGRELREKGISSAQVEEALEQFDCDENAGRACCYIKRKYAGHISEEKYKNRAQNALLRLGYSYSEIRQAIGMTLLEEQEEDIDS